MDPYFRPILISSALVVILNTILIIPIPGAPFFSYLMGGVLAVLFFKNEMNAKDEDYEIKVFDVSVLGVSVGVLVGAILTFIMTLKLRNPEIRQSILDTINEAMRMRSDAGFQALDDLGPLFYVITAVITILLCSTVSFFGSLATLPFINKPRK
jgi:hypothetical protein